MLELIENNRYITRVQNSLTEPTGVHNTTEQWCGFTEHCKNPHFY